eukprot:6895097-Alexandrium_andersonii.AAC.1
MRPAVAAGNGRRAAPCTWTAGAHHRRTCTATRMRHNDAPSYAATVGGSSAATLESATQRPAGCRHELCCSAQHWAAPFQAGLLFSVNAQPGGASTAPAPGGAGRQLVR